MLGTSLAVCAACAALPREEVQDEKEDRVVVGETQLDHRLRAYQGTASVGVMAGDTAAALWLLDGVPVRPRPSGLDAVEPRAERTDSPARPAIVPSQQPLPEQKPHDGGAEQAVIVGCGGKPHAKEVEEAFRAGYLAAGVGVGHLEAFVCRIVPCESSWWTYAVSPGGHLGLAQFAPTTWNSVASRTGRSDWMNPYDQGYNSAVLAADSGLGPWSCW